MLKNGKLWLGLLLSALALTWALRGVNLDDVWAALAKADVRWLVPALVFYIGGYWSRAARVTQLLEPVKAVPARRAMPPLVIGFLFNNILPGRLGEFIFAYLLGLREGISRSAAFAVVVLSRVMDGLTIVAFFLFGLFTALHVQAGAGSAGLADFMEKFKWAVGFFGLAAIVCLLLILRRELALRLADRMLRFFPERFSEKGRQTVEKFIDGLGVLRDPRRLFSVFAFNFVPWGMELLTYFFGAKALGFDMTLRQSALVMGATNLMLIVPGAPGGVGLFEMGGGQAMALVLPGLPAGTRIAFVLLVHAIILLPINVWGAWYLWREGISFQQVLRRGGSREESAQPEPSRGRPGRRRPSAARPKAGARLRKRRG